MRFEVPALDGRTLLVTGANRGIGLAVSQSLARAGAHVVLLCRTDEDGVRAAATLAPLAPGGVSTVGCDLSDPASVVAASRELCERLPRLDGIVHNAGVYASEITRTARDVELTFAVDVLGPFLLTRRIEPLLHAGARIVQLAGIYHLAGTVELDDLQFVRRPYDPAAANAQAQLARVVLACAWSRRLAERGVTVNAVHPGPVLTDAIQAAPWAMRVVAHTVARPAFHKPAGGAAPVVRLVTDPSLHVTGMFFRRYRLHASSLAAHDLSLAKALWAACDALCADAD